MIGWVERDLMAYEQREEAWLASRPECDICGDKIVDEYTYVINGDYLCEECAREWFEKQKMDTEVLIDDEERI